MQIFGSVESLLEHMENVCIAIRDRGDLTPPQRKELDRVIISIARITTII